MPGIADAVADLREAVRMFVAEETQSPDGVLAAVFALNNALGLRLRAGDPGMRELQLKVNQVTVAAKGGDREKARDSMSAVLDAFADLDRLQGA